MRKSKHRYLETGEYTRKELVIVDMEVTFLQLAIILEKEDIVSLMLGLGTNESNATSTFYEMIGQSQSIIHSEEDGDQYFDLYKMLHDTTPFHLAARFHANSLKLLLDHARAHEIDMEDLITKGQSPTFSSALHYAACNSDVESIRYDYEECYYRKYRDFKSLKG